MKFNCPVCGQRLECQTVALGMQIACPNCRQQIQIDSSSSVETDVPATPAPPPAPASPTTIAGFLSQATSQDATPSPDAGPLMLSALRGGEYALSHIVRFGGQGVILGAKDINLRRTVAMKVVRDPQSATHAQSIRFIEEAQITSQLEHPNIVPIHEMGIDSGKNVFYTMKMVEGITLRQILSQILTGDPDTIQRYPLATLLTILQKVCDAVAFAHSRCVVHRDLKPENIMVGEYGEVLVMDWGLAKIIVRNGTPVKCTPPHATGGPLTSRYSRPHTVKVESVRAASTTGSLATMSGEIMGSPGYMAPEQASGNGEEIDERTDIYALGALLYNILTLEIPIQGEDIQKMLNDILHGNIRHPLSFNRKKARSEKDARRRRAQGMAVATLPHCPGNQVPDSLAAVAMKAMSLKPEDRYPSVKAIQKDIEAYQMGFATSAEQAGMLKHSLLFIQRHKGMAIGAAALFTLLVAGSIVNLQQRLKTDRSLEEVQKVKQLRSEDRKTSAPEMVRSVKLLIEQNNTRDALTALTRAIEYDPSLMEARILNTLLLLDQRNVPAALKHAREAVRLMPNHPDAVELTRICTTAARTGSEDLPNAQLAALCTRHDVPTLASRFSSSADSQIQNFRAKLEKAWPGTGGLLTETNGGALTLNLRGRENVSEISRLRGIPLRQLSLRGTSVTNYMPLQNMPLISLDLAGTPATRLNIPPSLPLEHLTCGAEDPSSSFSPLTDISPLKGLRLGRLDMNPCSVTSISALAGMPITNLQIHAPVTSLAALRGMPLTELTLVGCTATSLEPLRGMPLTRLVLSQVPLPDISALRDLKLTELRLDNTRTADLSPLQGMPLTRLDLVNLPISDLTPLEGLPLQSLNISRCPSFADISPIEKMPLTALEFNNCPGLRDFSPVRHLPLQNLRLVSCPGITDLNPLQGMKTLTSLHTDVPGPVHELTAALTNSIQVAADRARIIGESYRNVPALADAATTALFAMERLVPLFSSSNLTPPTIPTDAVPHNGHHYWSIAPNFQCTWPEAAIIANRLGGHLATITTQEEMDWVKSSILAKSTTPRWLGGAHRAIDGVWSWITGEDWTLKNWAHGQPDNAGGAERCLAARPDGTWMDEGDRIRHGLLIEWDR